MALGDETDPILVKQNDTRPKVRYYPKQGAAQTPVSLTGATVVFNMRLSVPPATVAVNRAATTLVDSATGVEYTPTVAWSGTNGTYHAEFEATFPDGGIQTFPPGDKYIWIKVGDDIA